MQFKNPMKCRTRTDNVMVAILAWGGLGCGVAALASNRWMRNHIGGGEGLFKECYTSDICFDKHNPPSWLIAVRAFMIMMIVASIIACCVNVVSLKKCDKMLRYVSAVIFLIAGVFGIVAASIVTAKFAVLMSKELAIYGPGFVEAWLGSWMTVVASIFAFLSTIHMDSKLLNS